MTIHNPKSSMCKPYTSMCKPKKLTHNKPKFKTPKTANTQTNEWNVENNQHIWDQDQTTNTESHHNIIKSQIESKTRKRHKQMPMHSYIQTHFEQLQRSQKKSSTCCAYGMCNSQLMCQEFFEYLSHLLPSNISTTSAQQSQGI